MKLQFLNKLLERKDLSLDEAQTLMEGMLKGSLTPSQIAAFLTALRMKGETTNEILGFIKVLRKHMVKIKTSGLVIDTCGTGGDGKGTFNISTAVAFVVVGAGVKVAKHGNRAVSSLCGSADVLEALGVNINLTPVQAEEVLEKVGMVFLFAPLFHPAFKNVSPVRKELGVRTIFNYLGPFLNPVQAKRQLIGVANRQMAEKLATAATKLDYEYLLIVTGEDGIDEVSLSGKTVVFEVRGQTKAKRIVEPVKYGFRKAGRDEIIGGGILRNAEIIKDILKGEQSAKQDIVVLNSAAALYVAGKVKKVEDGVVLARKVINEGRAKKILSNLISETQKYA